MKGSPSERKAALLAAAEALYDRAFYSSPYPNPSNEDKAWKQGMTAASRLIRKMAEDSQ